MNLHLTAGPVVFGDVTYPLGGTFGPRLQADFQLVVLHRGELDLRLDDSRVQVAAGEAILLSPRHREHFVFSPTTETRHSWCAIAPSAVARNLRRLFRAENRPTLFGERMNTVFEWGQAHDQRSRENLFVHLALALMNDFLLAANANSTRVPVPSPALVRLAALIRRDFAQPLNLSTMARLAAVSPQHLLKLCRQRGLPSPAQQLYGFRLETAAEWLAGTGLSVGEIADRCGFVNPFHFSRRFKQAYGLSPLAWRQRRWHGGAAEAGTRA